MELTSGRGLNDQDSIEFRNVVVLSENTVEDFLEMSNEESL